MMNTESRILEAIYKAIDQMNERLPPGKQLVKSGDTALIHAPTGLDSIELVGFVVAVEDQLMETLDASISLADAIGHEGDHNPFETVGTLALFIGQELEGEGHG